MGIFSKLFPKPDGETTGAPSTPEGEQETAAPAQEASASANAPKEPGRAPLPSRPDQGAGAEPTVAKGSSARAATPRTRDDVPPATQRSAPRPGQPAAPVTKARPQAPQPQPPQPPKPLAPVAAPKSARGSQPDIKKVASDAGFVPNETVPKRGSKRPPAPDMSSASGSLASIADTFERLVGDVDSGFAAIQRRHSDQAPALPGADHADLGEVRDLFAHLAANHVRHVRDFMIDVRWGQATVDWIDICEPAICSLQRAADKLALAELSTALDAFAETLRVARAQDGHRIDGVQREAVLASHAALAAIMPQAFALDLDRTQRESVIIQSLLAQVPDVRRVTIEKLYGAGLTTLEAMFLAKAGDVVATTGIPPELAERIVARFRAYRREIQEHAPDPTRSRERERIAELLVQLRRQQDEYDRASAEWSKEAVVRKKEMRDARAQTLLDVNVVLARLGEVDLLRELERASFEQKIVQIERFLREARDKYQAEPPAGREDSPKSPG